MTKPAAIFVGVILLLLTIFLAWLVLNTALSLPS